MASSQPDLVTKGMSSWNSEDDAVWSNYTSWQASLIRPHLGRRVLEIGAGTGRLTELLVRDSQQFDRYVALEPSLHFFPILSRRIPKLEAVNGSIDALPKEFEGAFDTVFSAHVLVHIDDDLAFLKSAGRFLRPEGKLIMLVPALDWLMSPLDRNIGHYRRYDKAMARSLADRLGYQLTWCRYDNLIGVIGYWWICKVRKVHYQSPEKKTRLMGAFWFFDRVVLPAFSHLEAIVPPPIGLSLTAVFSKPAATSSRP
jgi:SAM-dependent methyltransferase